jgi:hypothetical protein
MPKKRRARNRVPAKRQIPKPLTRDGNEVEEENGYQLLASDAPLGYNPIYDAPPFTDFGNVTPDTLLGTLNLNWRERDLPERVRTKHVHRLHPYLGKYIPQLVEIFLRKYAPRRVYDPFCGSGTTLVEASVLGIESIGCDISPFNCLLSKVKTDRYDTDRLSADIKAIINEFSELAHESQKPSLFGDHELKTTDNEYLTRWFHPQALSELLTFRDLIPRHEHQDLLKVILSRAARSARLTTHFDLDFPRRPQTEPYECYKHSRTCYPTTSAYKFIIRYCWDTLSRVLEYARLRKDVKATVINGDSRCIKFPKVDMVMTSPPYVGLIDYHEQHRYAYELLGLSREGEPSEIGPAKRGSSQAAKQAYADGIADVLLHTLDHVTPNGVMVVVVGDRHDLYGSIAKRLGVRIEHILRRHVNRRTGRRSTDFYEQVIVWRKE